MLLTLEDPVALEPDADVINSNDELKLIIQQLDKLFLKVKILEKFDASEAFDSY